MTDSSLSPSQEAAIQEAKLKLAQRASICADRCPECADEVLRDLARRLLGPVEKERDKWETRDKRRVEEIHRLTVALQFAREALAALEAR